MMLFGRVVWRLARRTGEPAGPSWRAPRAIPSPVSRCTVHRATGPDVPRLMHRVLMTGRDSTWRSLTCGPEGCGRYGLADARVVVLRQGYDRPAVNSVGQAKDVNRPTVDSPLQRSHAQQSHIEESTTGPVPSGWGIGLRSRDCRFESCRGHLQFAATGSSH